MGLANEKYMTLRYLRYFVAVAQALNLTRAAEVLGMAQPPLSQQIRRLEAHVGTPLFRRKARGMALTPAGEVFYADALRILELASKATHDARALAAGAIGTMTVGFCNSVVFVQPLAELIRRYREQYPGVHFSPLEASTPELVERLDSGQIDAAVIRLPYAGGNGQRRRTILTEDMYIALPPGHIDTAREHMDLARLAQDPLVMYPRAAVPGLYDMVIEACHSHGFEPRLGQSSSQVASAINLVAAGFGYAVVPESIRDIHPQRVTYHRLRNPAIRSGIALTYRADASPAVQQLLALWGQAACLEQPPEEPA